MTLNTIDVYTDSQNTMNATASGLVFANNADFTIPLGAPPLMGRKNITAFFDGLFKTMKSFKEKPSKYIVANGDDFVSYAKSGSMVPKMGAQATFQAITMWKTDPKNFQMAPDGLTWYAPVVWGITTFETS